MLDYRVVKHDDINEITFDNGIIKLVIVPEQGGRVVEFSINNLNVLFRNEKYKYTKADIRKKREENNWINYGGYKGWCAPQGKWGWPPYFEIDLNLFKYEIIESKGSLSIELRSVKSVNAGLQFIRRITMNEENNTIKIKESIVNISDEIVKWGVWGNTQALTPGYCEIGFNSDIYFGGLTFYQDYKIPTARMNNIFERNNKTLKINCDNKDKFKIGTVTDKEEIKYYCTAYKNKKILFSIGFKYEGKIVYPHGNNVEIFVDDLLNYNEIEVLGEESEIMPGKSKFIDLTWKLEIL